MKNLYSLGNNGPGQPPRRNEPKTFKPKPMIAANNAINSFSRNGLFHATNLSVTSKSRAMNQMILDSNINKK